MQRRAHEKMQQHTVGKIVQWRIAARTDIDAHEEERHLETASALKCSLTHAAEPSPPWMLSISAAHEGGTGAVVDYKYFKHCVQHRLAYWP